MRILLVGSLLILFAAASIAFLGRKGSTEGDLTGLSGFTVKKRDKVGDYLVYGDHAKIRTAIPAARTAKVEVTGDAVQYNFLFPSGNAGLLTCDQRDLDRPCSLLDDDDTSFLERVSRRLGIAPFG